MQRMQNQKIQGLSGYLSVDGNGRIHRDLDWAQIQGGKAIILPPLQQAPIADELETVQDSD
jgi:outer membrane PBP1 activator LpoA protein